MKRYRQTVDELIGALSPIKVDWKDEHSHAVLELLRNWPQKSPYGEDDIYWLLQADFQAGLTLIRLILDLSKDEFFLDLGRHLGEGGLGIKRF